MAKAALKNGKILECVTSNSYTVKISENLRNTKNISSSLHFSFFIGNDILDTFTAEVLPSCLAMHMCYFEQEAINYHK